MIEALNEFKSDNPSFIGGKYIYAPIKMATNETIAGYFEVIRRIHKKFPEFVVGFDLVGQEDPSPPLVKFAEQILLLPDDIKFYFHAGETNWYGSIDENLVCFGRTTFGYCFPSINFIQIDSPFCIYSFNVIPIMHRLMRCCLAPVELAMAMR